MQGIKLTFKKWAKQLANSKFAILTVLLLLINVWQKLYYINYHSIWGDEAYTLWFGLHSFEEMLPTLTTGNDAPVYFVLMHFYIKLFGIDNFSVRILSVIFNTATLAVICLIAKKFVNIRFALYSAILFITSSILLHYALEVRPYALATLLASCSLYLYLSLYKGNEKNTSTAVTLGLVNALMFYTHYVTAIFILVQVLLIPFIYRFGKGKYKPLILSYLITAICTLPYVFKLFPRLGSMKGSWQQIPDLNTLWQNLVSFAQTSTLLYIYVLLIITGFILLVIRRTSSSSFKNYYVYITFTACYILPVMIIYFISLYSPIFISRYFLYTCLAFYLAIAYAYDLLPLPNWIKIAASVYFAYQLAMMVNIGPFTNEEWKMTMPIIKKHQTNGAVTFIQPVYQDGTFAYHYKQKYFENYDSTKSLLLKKNIIGINDSGDIKSNLKRYSPGRIVLVQTQWTITDPENTAQKFLDTAYNRIELHDYLGVKVSIYNKK